jgi:hypothetical protein
MFYHVELKRVSYVNLCIEAESPEEAEKLAWDELASDGSYGEKDAEWECSGVYKQETNK